MDNLIKEMLGYEVAEVGSSLFDDHQYSSAKPALLPNQGRARSSFDAITYTSQRRNNFCRLRTFNVDILYILLFFFSIFVLRIHLKIKIKVFMKNFHLLSNYSFWVNFSLIFISLCFYLNIKKIFQFSSSFHLKRNNGIY